MKFVDECHISTKNDQQTWGYAPRGEVCIVDDNFVRRERHTVVGIISIYEFLTRKMQAGSMNTADYTGFIIIDALAELTPGDKLIFDNAGIHEYEFYIRILGFLGVTVYWLPPYSPHLNPIELVWRGMKKKMSSVRELTRVEPVAAAELSLETYYDKDLSSLYAACGYYR